MEIVKILFSGLIGNIIGVLFSGIISFCLLKRELSENNKRKIMPILNVLSIEKEDGNDSNQRSNYAFCGMPNNFDYGKKTELFRLRFRLNNIGSGKLLGAKLYIFTYVKNKPEVNNRIHFKNELGTFYSFEIDCDKEIIISNIPYYTHICHYYIFKYNDIFGNSYMRILYYDGNIFSYLNLNKMKRFKIDYSRKDESNPNNKIVEKDFFKDLEKSLKKVCKDILNNKYEVPFANNDVLYNAS